MQSQLTELQAKGLGLAAISYDPVDNLAAFSRQRGITFPLLSDTGSATIKRYGILNPVPEEALGQNKDDPAVKADMQKYGVGPNAAMVGIAFPGTFILDHNGRVTSRFFEDFYVERNTVSNLLVRLRANTAPVAATRISSTHLDLTTYPSDSAVAVGNRLSLVLDIKPGPGVHVYAPGAKGLSPHRVDHRSPTKSACTSHSVSGVTDLFLQAAERTSPGLPEAVHIGAGDSAGGHTSSANRPAGKGESDRDRYARIPGVR